MGSTSVILPWVKNVYKLWVNIGKSIGRLSTPAPLTHQISQRIMDNSPFIRTLSAYFHHTYTHSILQNNLCYMGVIPTIHRAYYYENELKKGSI